MTNIDPNEYLWSTRGQDWDFRILHHPIEKCEWLLVYEEAFGRSTNDTDFFSKTTVRINGRLVSCVAFRFIDPESRRDHAGRLIPHEFIVLGSSADEIDSCEQGKSLVWPLVKDEYAGLYDTNPFRSSGADETNNNSAQKPPPDSSFQCGTAVIVAILSVLGLLLYAFYPNGTIGVRGKVVFSDNTPLSEGVIVWTNENTTRTTTLDHKGNFRLSTMKPGKYAVSFTGEAAKRVDAKYLDSKTSGLSTVLEKTSKPGDEKEFVVNITIEKNGSLSNEMP